MKIKKSELQDMVSRAIEKVSKSMDIAPPVKKERTDHYLVYKFPTLKNALTSLLGEQYMDFVDVIDWVVPRPSTFKVDLQNGEVFFLKWTGKSYQAQIAGKRYNTAVVSEYQQALEALGELLKYNPIKRTQEEGFSDDGQQIDLGAEPGDLGGGTEPGEGPDYELTQGTPEEEADIEAIPTT